MIDHDRKICEKALKLNNAGDISDMEVICVTEEGREFIRKLAVKAYHREEAQAGMI